VLELAAHRQDDAGGLHRPRETRMTIRKIGASAKYCVTSDFDEFDEQLQVTVDFAANGFWEKHIAHEGTSTRDKAKGRQKVADLDTLEDLDEIEAVLELQGGGVKSAADKSTLVRLKKVTADDAIYRFAKALALSYYELQKKWPLQQFRKDLPMEVTFEIPDSVVSYDAQGTKTRHRSMRIGAKLVSNTPGKWAFVSVHCSGPGSA
jgi:hypothetical protein